MSTQKITSDEFVYSILYEISDYAKKISSALKLAEVDRSEIRKFILSVMYAEGIVYYFRRYVSLSPPSDDENCLEINEIENLIKIFNQILQTNYWYEF